jgi:predicted dehydrogenase
MTPERHKTTRRALAGGVAGAFLIVRPDAVRGSQANSKISVGLIGSGNRGSYDASVVHSDPRARITALCDLFDDQIEKAKAKIKVENPAVYKDFEKLLASGVDAVFITAPVFEHPRMLEAAVAARKHIYCEKPAGADFEGCRRVIAAGRRQDPKKCLAFGFQQRYSPAYLAAYKALAAGEIGKLTSARGYWLGGTITPMRPRAVDPDPRINKLRNWYSSREYSGDFIVEQDCHNFDDLHWFIGAVPERATGYGGKSLHLEREVMDHLCLAFEFPGSLHVAYEASQNSPPGLGRVGEEYCGSLGGITTSRSKSVVMVGKDAPRVTSTPRDITYDAIENFLGRILSGDVENVAERAARSTMIALLGRTAIYERREATWKGEFGDV